MVKKQNNLMIIYSNIVKKQNASQTQIYNHPKIFEAFTFRNNHLQSIIKQLSPKKIRETFRQPLPNISSTSPNIRMDPTNEKQAQQNLEIIRYYNLLLDFNEKISMNK
jgi:hypothetical protein